MDAEVQKQKTDAKTIVSYIIVFILYAGLVAIIAKLTDEVLDGDTLAIDVMILESINTLSSPWLEKIMIFVTQFGSVMVVGFVSLLISGFLVYKKHYQRLLTFLASLGGAAGLIVVLKELFARSRPELWDQLVVETSYSFPSGHSLGSAALALTIVALLWATKWRALAIFAAIDYILLIGFSRMYLGVHYPTDVLAGWLIAGAWLVSVLLINHFVRKKFR